MKIHTLGVSDIQAILDLDRRSFPPGLQVSEDTVITRFAKGHTMLGIKNGERLIAKICFYYSDFHPRHMELLPYNFRMYSQQKSMPPTDACTISVYNLDVDPEFRGGKYAINLLKAVADQAKKSGCTYVIGDGRCPSYNGSPPEGIAQNLEFKKAIDAYLAGGPFPTDEQLRKDKMLGFYQKATGCVFSEIIPNFIPEDPAAGDLRVLLVMNVADQPATLSEEWAQLSEDFYDKNFSFELGCLIQKEDGGQHYLYVIEYGCGSGKLAAQLASSGYFEVTAIESDPIVLEAMEKYRTITNLEFKQSSWLDFVPEQKYDAAICKGNSIAFTNCWGTQMPSAGRMRELIQESLRRMFDSLRTDGLLYVDTINETAYRTPKEYRTIETQNCFLRGLIEHDYEACTRKISGKGWVNNKWFEGGAVGYLLSPLELYQMIAELSPRKIWFQKMKSDSNYIAVCAIK